MAVTREERKELNAPGGRVYHWFYQQWSNHEGTSSYVKAAWTALDARRWEECPTGLELEGWVRLAGLPYCSYETTAEDTKNAYDIIEKETGLTPQDGIAETVKAMIRYYKGLPQLSPPPLINTVNTVSRHDQLILDRLMPGPNATGDDAAIRAALMQASNAINDNATARGILLADSPGADRKATLSDLVRAAQERWCDRSKTVRSECSSGQ